MKEFIQAVIQSPVVFFALKTSFYLVIVAVKGLKDGAKVFAIDFNGHFHLGAFGMGGNVQA